MTWEFIKRKTSSSGGEVEATQSRVCRIEIANGRVILDCDGKREVYSTGGCIVVIGPDGAYIDCTNSHARLVNAVENLRKAGIIKA